jgi:hypothetical protein
MARSLAIEMPNHREVCVRRIALAIVTALLSFAAVVVPGMSAVANAATCHTGGTTTTVLFVESCGTSKEVTYRGPEKFGHVKIWEKSNVNHWANSAKDEWWGPLTGDRQSYLWSVSWSDATCAQFFWDQNGTYTQYGTIVCTSA